MTLQWGTAGEFANQFGVKCVGYGAPGSGKTPLAQTAPRPVLLATEPGLLSMRGSTMQTARAETPADVDVFFDWLARAPEAKNYDTVCIDSGSHLAEIILGEELSKKSRSGAKVDGKAAYGELSMRAMVYFNTLYYTREKHIYIIAKQDNSEAEKKPYFPGKDLNVKIPHLFDLVMQLTKTFVQGHGDVMALRTKPAYEAFARDRSGKLAEFEPPNLTNLFNKIMQG